MHCLVVVIETRRCRGARTNEPTFSVRVQVWLVLHPDDTRAAEVPIPVQVSVSYVA
jgi:hypothetical protein